MPFTLGNLKEDLEDLGCRFDGAPDLEFRSATEDRGLVRTPDPPPSGADLASARR